MRPYSLDLRVRVLEAAAAGDGTAALADRFAVSPAWVCRLRQRHRATGEVGPRVARPARTRTLEPLYPRIRQLLAATPDLTPAEPRDELRAAVALSTLWAAVRSLGYAFKKSRPGGRAGPAGRPGRPRRLAGRGRPGS
jgi:transposase